MKPATDDKYILPKFLTSWKIQGGGDTAKEK